MGAAFVRLGRALVVMLGAIAACHVAAQSASRAPAPFSTHVERCIIPAAQYHGVNYHVLRAIFRVESALRPDAVGQNGNGTKDWGIAQINSIHLPRLKKQGIYPEHLLDECIGSYVGASILADQIRAHGLNWEAIARYHSANPYLNYRYRVLLHNELVRSGLIEGSLLKVPPMPGKKPTAAGAATRASGARTPSSTASTSSVVLDAPSKD